MENMYSLFWFTLNSCFVTVFEPLVCVWLQSTQNDLLVKLWFFTKSNYDAVLYIQYIKKFSEFAIKEKISEKNRFFKLSALCIYVFGNLHGNPGTFSIKRTGVKSLLLLVEENLFCKDCNGNVLTTTYESFPRDLPGQWAGFILRTKKSNRFDIEQRPNSWTLLGQKSYKFSSLLFKFTSTNGIYSPPPFPWAKVVWIWFVM